MENLSALRCKEQVKIKGCRGVYVQCSRHVVKDGYCTIHHPDSVKIRDEKKLQTSQNRLDNSPWVLLSKVKEELAQVRTELEIAKARVAELEDKVTGYAEHYAGESI